MPEYIHLKQHYIFAQKEAEILQTLQPRMEELADQFINVFYDYNWEFGKTATL